MRSLRPGVRRSRSDQPHRRSGRSRVSDYHPSRAFALHVEPKRNRRRSKIAVRCRRTGGGSEQRCQNLSASGGCSRAQIHRWTQDNGLDRHASVRVSGPKKAGETPSAALVMTSRPPPEALIHRKGISCRSYATKLERYQTRIAVSRSSARQSFTATSPISPASPPTRLSAISKRRLLKCCDASMSFSTSREPTNHSY